MLGDLRGAPTCVGAPRRGRVEFDVTDGGVLVGVAQAHIVGGGRPGVVRGIAVAAVGPGELRLRTGQGKEDQRGRRQPPKGPDELLSWSVDHIALVSPVLHLITLVPRSPIVSHLATIHKQFGHRPRQGDPGDPLVKGSPRNWGSVPLERHRPAPGRGCPAPRWPAAGRDLCAPGGSSEAPDRDRPTDLRRPPGPPKA